MAFTLQIPAEAAQLMAKYSANEVFERMINNSGLRLIELETFAMIITPIKQESYGKAVGYVAYWHNGWYTVHLITPESDFINLIGGTELNVLLSVEGIVALFERHYDRYVQATKSTKI